MKTGKTKPGANPVLLARVQAKLTGAVEFREQKMFGGITFMVRERMCVSVGRSGLMCCIDPDMHDKVLEGEGARTVVMRGREYRGYIRVDEGAVATEAALGYWIALALDYNRKRG